MKLLAIVSSVFVVVVAGCSAPAATDDSAATDNALSVGTGASIRAAVMHGQPYVETALSDGGWRRISLSSGGTRYTIETCTGLPTDREPTCDGATEAGAVEVDFGVTALASYLIFQPDPSDDSEGADDSKGASDVTLKWGDARVRLAFAFDAEADRPPVLQYGGASFAPDRAISRFFSNDVAHICELNPALPQCAF